MVLEWKSQSAYALTELVFFIIICTVILATVAIAVVVLLMYFKKNSSFFSILRPLFENVFTTAIAFSQERGGKIKVVFLGYKEKGHEDPAGPRGWKETVVRVWVHIYLTLLCSVGVLWFLAVFSDTVLYRKTSTCLDVNVRFTNTQCFLLSTEGVPPEIQEIIDLEEGNVVPCQRVQNYLLLNNITYDLEVICYQSQLNPLAALGVAYGTMKAMIFVMTTVIAVLFWLFKHLPSSVSCICVAHTVQIGLSIVITIIIIAVIASLHTSSGPRNTSFDYLRGDRFFNTSITGLISVTIIVTFGLFPWWAFKPLEKVKASCNTSEELRHSIHNMILHHQFSTYYGDKKNFNYSPMKNETETKI